MPEFRPVSASERAAFDRTRQYAFQPEEGPYSGDSDGDENERLGTHYGYFDDGELASICIHYPFELRLREEWTDVGGLGAVATPPERRREGNVRDMLAESVRTMASDVALVALWPFSTAFYRQFGWATANDMVRYEIPVGTLIDYSAEGCFRSVEPADWRDLREVHLAATRGETLSMRRSEQWWRRRILHDWSDDRRHAYAYYRDGAPAGYVVYDVERDDDRTLEVAYHGARDHAALRALLGFLGDHDSQVETVVLERSGEDGLFDTLAEPNAAEATVRPGPMVRLTDVADGLEAIPYPEDSYADVTLSVEDPLLEDNDGTYRLLVEDGTGVCQTAPDTSPDGRLDIGSLSQLAIGARSVETLSRTGDLSADMDARGTLARVFPPARVYLREFF